MIFFEVFCDIVFKVRICYSYEVNVIVEMRKRNVERIYLWIDERIVCGLVFSLWWEEILCNISVGMVVYKMCCFI